MSKSPTEKRTLKALGLKLREARSKRHLTQESVAETAKMSRIYYNGIENGNRNVSFINIIRIIQALGVESSDEILDLPYIKACQETDNA